jgi:tetratricopeptide (TPR) repeat protein
MSDDRQKHSLAVHMVAISRSCVLLLLLGSRSTIAETAHGTPVDNRLVLQEAERLLVLGQVEKARRLLQPLAANLRPNAPLSTGIHRITRLLAEAYLRSKQYDRAESLAMSCRKYWAAASDSNGELVAEQQDAVLLLAAVHEYRKSWKQAATFLHEALELNDAHPRKNPVWQIEVLSRLARAWTRAGEAQKFEATLARLHSHVESLQIRYSQHEVSLDRFDRAISAFARCLSECGRVKESVGQWQRLLSIYNTANDNARQAEIWSELAAVYGAANDSQLQLASLDRSAALWQRHLERISNAAVANEQPLLISRFRLAQVYKKRAEAVTAAGDLSKTISSLRESQHAFEVLVHTLDERRASLGNANGNNSSTAIERRVSRDELEFIDTFLLAVLHELRNVRTLLADQVQSPDAAEGKYDLKISQRIHDLSANLYADDDPRIYRAKVQLAALAKGLGKYSVAHRHLIAAWEYWQLHLRQQTREMGQIADLLADVEREMAWNLPKTERKQALQQARSRLEAIPAETKAQLESSDPELLCRIQLNHGRLCFEADGDWDMAIKSFQDAEQLARKAGDQAAERFALDFQRALWTATLQHDQLPELLERIHHLIDQSANSQVTVLLANAANHLAQRRFDEATSQLDRAVSICPDDDPQRASLDQLSAIGQFLQIGHSVGKKERIRYGDVEKMRNYWLSVINANQTMDDLASIELRNARALYYLSRLRYFEWHAAREHWKSMSTSPALGRSAAYEDRRNRHAARCDQYKSDIDDFNEAALAVNREGLSSDSTRFLKLVDQERQLRVEYESLKQLGHRLVEEHNAESVNQAQLAGRAARDLSQLLREAAALAARSSESMAKLAIGPVDSYDPNLHYLALCNQAEILYAQVMTVEQIRSSDTKTRNAQRRYLSQMIDVLEAATGLMADPPIVKLGSFADPRRFIAEFDKGKVPSDEPSRVPTTVLLNTMQQRLSPENAPLDVLQRLERIAK